MLEPGAVVGEDYRVERKLSEGGMGAVFVAEQISTGAKRALKIIRPELLHEPKLLARFEQEAKVTSNIPSDHIVSVIAAGFDEELKLPWLAMELLTGETLLHAVQERGSLPRGTALAILKQLAHAMDAAHTAGVVHRDLKPENIFLADARRSGVPFFVKVLDFGIARVVREAHLTGTDSLGTPLWMSPEQTGMGESVGPWTDLWSLGLIVFYMLTGRSYWLTANGEGNTFGIMREICIDPIAPASERAKALGCERAIPEGFDDWYARCVTREVKSRFVSFGAAIAELEGIVGGSGGVASNTALAATEVVDSSKAKTNPIVKTNPNPVVAQKTPGVVSITNAKEEPPKKTSVRRIVAGGAIVLAVVGLAFGVRTMNQRKDLELCHTKGERDACQRVCDRGDRFACTRVALAGINSRDAAEAQRSVDLLRTACDANEAVACDVLGRALAFPSSSNVKRDPAAAVAALEKACTTGHGCAFLGSLKELGWSGIAKEAAFYFGAACGAQTLRTSEDVLDCELATARHPMHPFSQHMKPLDACKEHGGDLCGLAWLAKDAAPKEIHAAYERGCDVGSALACTNLAAMRAEGYPGLEPNPIAARETFERACTAGEPAACNNLAFVVGGLPASPRRGPRGTRLYKLRCGGPFQVGCVGWGERRDVVPRGTPVDIAQAVAALDRACQGGLTTACVNHGAFLYLGRGVPRDRARAEKLFSESCFRGDASACGEQGAALLTLRMDHPKDKKAGFGFLERACNAGEDDACAALYGHMLDDPKTEEGGAAGLERLAAREVFSHKLIGLYETGGVRVAKKPEEARRIALKVCETEARCSDAAYYLSRGIGGAKDERRALESLTHGCDEEDYASCSEASARAIAKGEA